jgi:multiple antibiotic resistance protein
MLDCRCWVQTTMRPQRPADQMHDLFDFLISSFVTLLVVVDPVSLAPVFVTLTRGFSDDERRHIALSASLLAAAILCGVALVGDLLLRQLGISLPAFRIAGGLLLFVVAFDMVLGWRSQREGKEAETAARKEHIRSVAAFPLATPLMAGPGAITATLLIAGRAEYRLSHMVILLGVIVAVAAACFAVYVYAARLTHLLGTTANLVLSRVLGLVLAALAVQYVIDGLQEVWPG